MGVPGLWPYIKNVHKNTIEQHAHIDKAIPREFDYVYLDANGLLHAAAQQVENYGAYKRNLNPYEKTTTAEKRLIIFDKFFAKILEVLRVIVPQIVVYIAIDGTAPRAKQNQQRERRFESARERVDKREKQTFDSASISPGTEFMHELSKYMYYRIRYEISNSLPNSFWRVVKVIYSPPTYPGEGEHKIMDYIRIMPQHVKDNNTHCLFGPDGDLIMLSLSDHVRKMFLFREDIDKDYVGYVHLVNIGKLNYSLARHMGMNRRKYHPDSVSNEFVIIGFFVGNDFLPRMKMMGDVKRSLKDMIKLYFDLCNGVYLTNKDKINFKTFYNFIERIARKEGQILGEQLQAELKSKFPIEEAFKDKTLAKYASMTPDGDVLSINMAEYREAYYLKAGISVVDLNSEVSNMCRDYIKTIIWAYHYYTIGLPSWSYSYRWHYSPLMSDVQQYLKNKLESPSNVYGSWVRDMYSFTKEEPSLPFEQLLSVLSPHSATLLPTEYSKLITEKDSYLLKSGYYPLEYDVDYEGKKQAHMGAVILPFVNFRIVQEEYKKVYDKSPYKYHKNEPTLNIEISYLSGNTEEGILSFTSEYGDIEPCNVLTTVVDY